MTATRGLLKATPGDILHDIQSREIFGNVKWSLEVPLERINIFSDFPPIFENLKIGLEDIGPHMKLYAKFVDRERGGSTSPSFLACLGKIW